MKTGYPHCSFCDDAPLSSWICDRCKAPAQDAWDRAQKTIIEIRHHTGENRITFVLSCGHKKTVPGDRAIANINDHMHCSQCLHSMDPK